jgi:hypothetical protein
MVDMNFWKSHLLRVSHRGIVVAGVGNPPQGVEPVYLAVDIVVGKISIVTQALHIVLEFRYDQRVFFPI